jgi:hypothetical protein
VSYLVRDDPAAQAVIDAFIAGEQFSESSE